MMSWRHATAGDPDDGSRADSDAIVRAKRLGLTPGVKAAWNPVTDS